MCCKAFSAAYKLAKQQGYTLQPRCSVVSAPLQKLLTPGRESSDDKSPDRPDVSQKSSHHCMCVCGHARQASPAGVWTCIWSSSLFNTDAVPQGLTGPVNASHKHASRLICHLQASACLDSARCWIVMLGKGLWSKCAHLLVHAPNWSCSSMPRLEAQACNTHLQVFAMVFPMFQHSNNGCSLYIYFDQKDSLHRRNDLHVACMFIRYTNESVGSCMFD